MNNNNSGNSGIANDFGSGSVHKNSGGSHVTTTGTDAHITTAVGGLNQGATYGVHTSVDGTGNVGDSGFYGPK
jgi:hypothetical protein